MQEVYEKDRKEIKPFPNKCAVNLYVYIYTYRERLLAIQVKGVEEEER